MRAFHILRGIGVGLWVVLGPVFRSFRRICLWYMGKTQNTVLASRWPSFGFAAFIAAGLTVDGVNTYVAEQAWCLAELDLNEAGNQSLLGRKLVRHVFVERALANRPQMWGGDTICKTVTHRVSRQRTDGEWVTTYQASYLDPTVQKRILQPSDRQIKAARIEIFWGIANVPEQYRLARYYLNPVITQKKNPKALCRFRASYVSLGTEIDHEFFRDTTKVERDELWKKLSPECKQMLRPAVVKRDRASLLPARPGAGRLVFISSLAGNLLALF